MEPIEQVYHLVPALFQQLKPMGVCVFCEIDRMKVYHEQTETLIDYYTKKNVYFKIKGEGTIETVFEKISALLDRELAGSQEVEITK